MENEIPSGRSSVAFGVSRWVPKPTLHPEPAAKGPVLVGFGSRSMRDSQLGSWVDSILPGPPTRLKGEARNGRGSPWKDGRNSLSFTCWVDPKTLPRSFAAPGTSLPHEHSLSFVPPRVRRGHLALSSLGITSRKNSMPERAPRARTVKLHLAPGLNSLPSPKQ